MPSSLKEPETNFVTRRMVQRETSKREMREEKPDMGKNVIQMDFFCAYSG